MRSLHFSPAGVSCLIGLRLRIVIGSSAGGLNARAIRILREAG